MIAKRIAVAIALTWPLGALAVDPITGSETDARKAARVAGWTGQWEGKPAREPARQVDTGRRPSTETASQIYRYGQREPVVEDLARTGKLQTETRVAAEP